MYSLIKRTFDFTASLVALTALSPLLIIIYFAVKITDPGPAFFRQTRVGMHGREFTLVKFRSMRVNQPKSSPKVTGKDDPRITGIGRFLRRTKLDELPELWNILVGDMSIVGYRPEVPEYVAHYEEDWRKMFKARPGLTDPVTLSFIDEEAMLSGVEDKERAYLEVIMPMKARFIVDYTENRSMLLDLKIIIQTAWAVTFGQFSSKSDPEILDNVRSALRERKLTSN